MSRKPPHEPELAAWADAILDLLSRRQTDASICPSEVARARGGARWREHMDDVRAAARELAARGVVEVTQGGEPVEPGLARGPIRIRLRITTRD